MQKALFLVPNVPVLLRGPALDLKLKGDIERHIAEAQGKLILPPSGTYLAAEYLRSKKVPVAAALNLLVQHNMCKAPINIL